MFAGYSATVPRQAEDLEAWFEHAAGLSKEPSGGDVSIVQLGVNGTSNVALVVQPRLSGLESRTAHVLADVADNLSELVTRGPDLETAGYEALFEIGTQIQDVQVSLQSVFELIVSRARELLATDVGWLALVDDGYQRVSVSAAAGVTSDDFLHMSVDVGTGIGGMAVEQRAVVVVRDQALYRNRMPQSVHRALRGEGVVSVACAPMVRGDTMVGALYVGSRQATDFSPHATALLSALAAQAAIAIENARLYHELCEKNATLEDAFSIHRSLTDLSLSGAGLDQIVHELERLLGTEIRFAPALCDTHAGQLQHAADGNVRRSQDTDADTDERLVSLVTTPVTAGDAQLGEIQMAADGQPTELELRTLEHGATVIALELVKRQAALEVEWRLRGEILEEILQSDGVYSEGLLLRATSIGFDLDCPRRLAVIRPTDETATPALLDVVQATWDAAGGHGPKLVSRRGDRVLVAFTAGSSREATEWVAAIQRRADRAAIETRAGVSALHTDVSTALRQAEAALRLCISTKSDHHAVIYEDLGQLRFLLDAPNTDEMETLVRDALGALVESDARRGGQSLQTLRVFLSSGGHHPTTADLCHIHASTLKYRLKRIGELLGCSLSDAGERFRLMLAFEVLDLLDALERDPFASMHEPEGGPSHLLSVA